MRYRPFGNSGKAVSAISLLLRESALVPTPAAWRGRLFTALESGVNCFEFVAGGPVLAAGLAAALPAVERGLLFIAMRVAGDPRRPLDSQILTQAIREALRQTGAGYFDLLMLDDAAIAGLTPDGRTLLADVHSAGLALQIGFTGEGDRIEEAITDPMFEVLATPFSLTSDWRTRRQVRDSAAAGMTAVAYDPLPQALIKPPPKEQKAASLLLRRPEASPLASAGGYGFLHNTPGWTPEELCLGYALTEPSFATVQLDALSVDVERLAAVVDRDMPTSTAAQIEMARFSADPSAAQRSA